MKKLLFTMLMGVILHSGAFAQDDENEWYGFDPGEAGISTTEFDMVKENGMSRKELEFILELGIMPEEYFSEPWKKLGVSKSEWINSKKQGLDDDDIDRRVYTQSRFNYVPLVTFFLPGYYQYKTDRFKFGGALSALAVAGLVMTFVHQDETQSGTNAEPEKSIFIIYPLITLLSMATSAADAYLGTRYHDNQGAARFSFDLTPNLEPSALISIDF